MGASAGALVTAEPSAAGGGTTITQRAMNSERQPRIPFSIADILGPRMVPRAPTAPQLPESCPDPTSPLCALEELTSKTFRGLDGRASQPFEGITRARSWTPTWLSLHFSFPGSWFQTFVSSRPGHPNRRLPSVRASGFESPASASPPLVPQTLWLLQEATSKRPGCPELSDPLVGSQ